LAGQALGIPDELLAIRKKSGSNLNAKYRVSFLAFIAS
jgi:hypothetical protein